MTTVPQKGLDPLQEGLPAALRAVVTDLRTVYTEGPFARLRSVEDAIVDARTRGADLVTVSSATCSRMLSPRRGPDGRTALPRWPSVRAFLVVHGVDPDPYEVRWAEARTAWAALPDPQADDPEPGDEDEPADAPSPPPRRGRRAVLLAAVGLLLFAAGTGFGLYLGRAGDPAESGAGSAEAVSPLALPSADLAVGPTGVACDPGPGGTVRFLGVTGADGAAGIPQSIRVDVEVIEPAAPGDTYWLMLRLFTEGLPFYAKAPVRTDTGLASYVLTFDSPIGSVRDLFVVEADPGAGQWLQDSYAADQAGDSSWAQKRGALPPGARTASGTCRVERTR
ncbi:hypothetical protein [Pseudonocardia oroxyli]|uniref:hypothetical protein n=1 Tax=Pseudonocardia oroxyli TaxID=366584 RepID=UPI000B813A63|nr:hypothetical protein [Pseudonocardia oroxyli]